MQVSRRFRERPHMKAIFISRYQRPVSKALAGTYDIAIISDDNRYIEYAIQIDKDKNLTYFQLTRFRSIFNKWKIDIRTSVCMTKTITVKHPLYIFFQILSHQIGFSLFRIDMDNVARGVARECPSYIWRRKNKKGEVTYKPSSEISISNIIVLWRKLVQNNRCPWINYDVDRYLRSKNDYVFLKRKQWVRLGGLYMVFKIWRKSYNDRHRLRLRMLTDRQIMEAESDRQDALAFPKLEPRFRGLDDPLLREMKELYGSDQTAGYVAGEDTGPALPALRPRKRRPDPAAVATIMTPDEPEEALPPAFPPGQTP